jgi:hypothetical protein
MRCLINHRCPACTNYLVLCDLLSNLFLYDTVYTSLRRLRLINYRLLQIHRILGGRKRPAGQRCIPNHRHVHLRATLCHVQISLLFTEICRVLRASGAAEVLDLLFRDWGETMDPASDGSSADLLCSNATLDQLSLFVSAAHTFFV